MASIKGNRPNPDDREETAPPKAPKRVKVGWETRLNRANLAEKTGITLSDREILIAEQDFQQEVGIDTLENIFPERLELVFAAYLRKWARRFQRKDILVEKYERKH